MRNPAAVGAARYFDNNQTNNGQRHSAAFNSQFDFNQPTLNVTTREGFQDPTFTGSNPQVLVNYIHHSQIPLVPRPPIDECERALGNPTAPVPGAAGIPPVPERTLKVTTDSNSFFACVDTQRNLARVTIRGNSLRRLQPNDANYNATRSAFFPAATVQVQGLGARGK